MGKKTTITITINPERCRSPKIHEAKWIAIRCKGDKRDRLHFCSHCGCEVELLAQDGVKLDRIVYFCPSCGYRMFRGSKKKNEVGEKCSLTVCEDLSEQEKAQMEANLKNLKEEYIRNGDILIID